MLEMFCDRLLLLSAASILLLVLASNQINCDQSVISNLQNETSAIQQEDRNTSLINANATSLNGATLNLTQEAQPADYKQRLSVSSADSSTKISYDTQHEQTTTFSAPSSTLVSQETSTATTSSANTTNLPIELTNTMQNSTETQLDKNRTTVAEAKTLVENAVSYSSIDLAPNNEQNSESSLQPTAEYLVAADSSASSSSSVLDDAPLDLDASLASTSSSVISRHGRASVANTYTPPASSRLSVYNPMLLQNSRAHSRNEQHSQQQQVATTRPQYATTQSQVAQTKATTPFDPIIVCYLGSWSVYRPSLAKFTPENINPFLCTHIIYAFAGLSSKYELKPFDSYNDITQGGYRKFTGLKDYNKQLKTLIAVGGWNEGSAR